MNALEIIERSLIEACILPGINKIDRERAIARRDFGQLALKYYRDENGGVAETGSLVNAADGMAYALAILFLASPQDSHARLSSLIFAKAEKHALDLGAIFQMPWIVGAAAKPAAEAST